jgi:hypothetical protein
MKIDKRHQSMMTRAIRTSQDGEPFIAIDLAAAKSVLDRLTLWEVGIITKCVREAARTTHPSLDQRALLAIFAYRGADVS